MFDIDLTLRNDTDEAVDVVIPMYDDNGRCQDRRGYPRGKGCQGRPVVGRSSRPLTAFSAPP